MPSDFTTIRAAPFDLPTGGDIDIDIEFPAPGVKANRRAILMFRLTVTGAASASFTASVLKATLNGRVIFEEKYFTSAPDRSLHKLVDFNTVKPVDNKLTLIRQSGTGIFHLSDLVLVYGI
jgi:hypothetical protein